MSAVNFYFVLFLCVLWLLIIYCYCYELLCLLSVILIVSPHPVSGTSASAQGIDSGTLGEASFWLLHLAHFLEGLLCSATGFSKKLWPQRPHIHHRFYLHFATARDIKKTNLQELIYGTLSSSWKINNGNGGLGVIWSPLFCIQRADPHTMHLFLLCFNRAPWRCNENWKLENWALGRSFV
jgi:hypothetical protein